jgi:hypothetical protein
MKKRAIACLAVFTLGLATLNTPLELRATSLDILEEMAQEEVAVYMQAHAMDIQHGPAVVSGSFKRIVLQASFIEAGVQKVATFVVDPTYDKQGRLPIRSVTIR